MSVQLGTDPSRKAAELTQLRALRRRTEKDRDAFELAFAILRDQRLFTEFRRADQTLVTLDQVIEKREAR